MTKETPVILMVEDTASLAAMYQAYLANTDYTLHHVTTLRDAFTSLDKFLPDIVLLDLMLPDGDGMELLSYISGHHLPIDVVIMTAYGSIDKCVEAMQKGAKDFITKPFPATRLQVTVANLLEKRDMVKKIDSFRDEFGSHYIHGLQGSSLAIQAVFRMIASAANTHAPILITGEPGTGKKTCAEAIHHRGNRHTGPYMHINCSLVDPNDHVEKIFGKVSGWLISRPDDDSGLLHKANNGTLAIHNIDALSVDAQQRLLRFLQTMTYSTTGTRKERASNARIVATLSTTKMNGAIDLKELPILAELYFKLSILHIHMPPLRDREQDILRIAEPLLREISSNNGKMFANLSDEVKTIFIDYDWPGNIHQMQQVFENIMALYSARTVTADMLPNIFDICKKRASLRKDVATIRISNNDNIKPLWQIEKQAIEKALEICDGDMQVAASALQVSPTMLFQKRRQWKA